VIYSGISLSFPNVKTAGYLAAYGVLSQCVAWAIISM
jgi:hypothetical protein